MVKSHQVHFMNRETKVRNSYYTNDYFRSKDFHCQHFYFLLVQVQLNLNLLSQLSISFFFNVTTNARVIMSNHLYT